MGDGIKNLIVFTSGLIIGSVATWVLIKNKYERKADEAMNEYFNRKREEFISETVEAETVVVDKNKPNITEYATMLDDQGYTNYSDISKKEEEKEEEPEMEEKPYVISPDEFGEFEDYETISLTYYKNGYVTDDQDILMSNDEVEEAIGWSNITEMGIYEEDALHVRNEKRKVDYEILQVLDNYQEE